jgi:hypothetical protein
MCASDLAWRCERGFDRTKELPDLGKVQNPVLRPVERSRGSSPTIAAMHTRACLSTQLVPRSGVVAHSVREPLLELVDNILGETHGLDAGRIILPTNMDAVRIVSRIIGTLGN